MDDTRRPHQIGAARPQRQPSDLPGRPSDSLRHALGTGTPLGHLDQARVAVDGEHTTDDGLAGKRARRPTGSAADVHHRRTDAGEGAEQPTGGCLDPRPVERRVDLQRGQPALRHRLGDRTRLPVRCHAPIMAGRLQ
jgi:hypothetical protein